VLGQPSSFVRYNKLAPIVKIKRQFLNSIHFPGVSPTTLHALSKLVSNVEIADDIIAVMRNILAQFPPKVQEVESIEIPLSVRLWRVSGCHELLASLSFDLMEVGQDQVTLRTGKQANRRNCQFVLQSLLALFGKFLLKVTYFPRF
jgi:hypothetical protein